MIIGSISENKNIEKRVALTPEILKKYKSLGLNMCVNKGYGNHIGFYDEDYQKEGVEVLETEKDVIQKSDIIIQMGILRDENLDGKESHVIKRIPLDPYSGYTKQIVWISKSNFLIHQIHHFDRKSFHVKTQTYSGYKKYLNKFWRPGEIHMINHQTNKTTTLFFQDMTFNTGLSDKDFTQNSLKRSK